MKNRFKDLLSGVAVVFIVVGFGLFVMDYTVETTNKAEQVCTEYNGDLISGQHYHCVLENGTEWHIVLSGHENQYVMAEPNNIDTCHSDGWLGCNNHFFTILGIIIFMAMIFFTVNYAPGRVDNW